MASYITLTLDTTAPANPSMFINTSGDLYTANQLVTCTISTTDASAVGYKIKIWGAVDTTNDTNVQTTEVASTYFSPTWSGSTTTFQVKLLTGDGSKTLNCKIVDDVLNPSGQATASITLNTTAPVITLTGDGTPKISLQATKNSMTCSFTATKDYTAWKVCVVPSTTSAQTAGVTIGANSGGAGTGATAKPVTILGADLQTASSGDGSKIIKAFVQDAGGLWSN